MKKMALIMLDISFGTLTGRGTRDDSDDFSRWDSLRIACRMAFINAVLHCWIVGIETLNRHCDFQSLALILGNPRKDAALNGIDIRDGESLGRFYFNNYGLCRIMYRPVFFSKNWN
jgi:hypothetical protein